MKSTTTTGRITVGTRRNTTDARCPDEIVSQQKTNNTIPQHAKRDLSAHRRFRYEVLQYSTTSKTEGPVGAGRYRGLLGRVAGPSDYSVEAVGVLRQTCLRHITDAHAHCSMHDIPCHALSAHSLHMGGVEARACDSRALENMSCSLKYEILNQLTYITTLAQTL